MARFVESEKEDIQAGGSVVLEEFTSAATFATALEISFALDDLDYSVF